MMTLRRPAVLYSSPRLQYSPYKDYWALLLALMREDGDINKKSTVYYKLLLTGLTDSIGMELLNNKFGILIATLLLTLKPGSLSRRSINIFEIKSCQIFNYFALIAFLCPIVAKEK